MLYIILELKDGTIVKGRALDLMKYNINNNDGPCFIAWTTGSKGYKHEEIKTISVWVE